MYDCLTHHTIQIKFKKNMKKQSFTIVLYTTMLCFAALYMPQPILPVIAAYFSLDITSAALVTSVTMIPLGLLPVLYGLLLNRIRIEQLLTACLFSLALATLLIALATNIQTVLLGRFIQGLLLPGLFTCLMTLAGRTSPFDSIKRAINFYVCFSILGGFSGRILSGLFSYFFSWNTAFYLLSFLLLIQWLYFLSINKQSRKSSQLIQVANLSSVIKSKTNAHSFIYIFLVFFLFASLLNFIPFRIVEITGELNEFTISFIYLGYLVGAFIAFKCESITRFMGSEGRAVLLAQILLLLASISTLLDLYLASFVAIFILCFGFFLLHSVLSAFLNFQNENADRSLVNSMYISSYYLGGSIGAFLPGFIYSNYDWNAYIVFISMIWFLSLIFYLKVFQK